MRITDCATTCAAWQVSDKERKLDYEHLFKDVAGVLAEKCINPTTSRPYTLSMLERALRDIHFSVDPNTSAKQQALLALPLLQAQFPIERARMRLRLSAPVGEQAHELEQLLHREGAEVESLEVAAGGVCTLVAKVDPGVFRTLHSFMQSSTQSCAGRLEVLSLAVTAGGTTADEFASLGVAPAAQPSTTASGRKGVTETVLEAGSSGVFVGFLCRSLLVVGSIRRGGTSNTPPSSASCTRLDIP